MCCLGHLVWKICKIIVDKIMIFFYLICLFLCPIANIEKEKIKLEIKLKETIELWSANTAQK